MALFTQDLIRNFVGENTPPYPFMASPHTTYCFWISCLEAFNSGTATSAVSLQFYYPFVFPRPRIEKLHQVITSKRCGCSNSHCQSGAHPPVFLTLSFLKKVRQAPCTDGVSRHLASTTALPSDHVCNLSDGHDLMRQQYGQQRYNMIFFPGIV